MCEREREKEEDKVETDVFVLKFHNILHTCTHILPSVLCNLGHYYSNILCMTFTI